jgi:RNA polymerase sigma-70 factor (ECF subfamily)
LSGTEERLKARFVESLAGDARAYQGFLVGLAAHLRAFYRRRLARLPDHVEDLVQEALLAVHNQRHTFDPAQPLTAWVHAIARYKLVDFLRRRGRGEAFEEPLDEADGLWSSAEDEATEARGDLQRLLDTLPERQRVPIVCVKVEGLSVAETARRTGMSGSAVKVAVHRGLKALAERMRDRR